VLARGHLDEVRDLVAQIAFGALLAKEPAESVSDRPDDMVAPAQGWFTLEQPGDGVGAPPPVALLRPRLRAAFLRERVVLRATVVSVAAPLGVDETGARAG